jgi:hypothetical protein
MRPRCWRATFNRRPACARSAVTLAPSTIQPTTLIMSRVEGIVVPPRSGGASISHAGASPAWSESGSRGIAARATAPVPLERRGYSTPIRDDIPQSAGARSRTRASPSVRPEGVVRRPLRACPFIARALPHPDRTRPLAADPATRGQVYAVYSVYGRRRRSGRSRLSRRRDAGLSRCRPLRRSMPRSGTVRANNGERSLVRSVLWSPVAAASSSRLRSSFLCPRACCPRAA